MIFSDNLNEGRIKKNIYIFFYYIKKKKTKNKETFRKHLTLTYRGLVYAKKCLKGPSDKFIQTKLVTVKDAKSMPNKIFKNAN